MAFEQSNNDIAGMPSVDLSVQFGKRVRELRKAAGISQEALANKYGFARSYMSKIERGLANVALDGIQRLADALGVPPKALFEEPTGMGSSPVKRAKPAMLVPFANDGTCFNPALRQPEAGTYVVGSKADRKRFPSFGEALAHLRSMGDAACWERPDGRGRRGVVKVKEWKPLPSEYLPLLDDSRT